MGLAAPWLLLFAAAAVVPYLLHRTRYRHREVVWSSVRFFEQRTETVRRRSWTQWLLLAARMAAVIAIALAAADPYWSANAGGDASIDRETLHLIWVDNSPSMTCGSSGAQQAADSGASVNTESSLIRSLIDDLPRSDWVSISYAPDGAEWSPAVRVKDFDVSQERPGDDDRTIDPAMLSQSIIALDPLPTDASLVQRVVHIVSDLAYPWDEGALKTFADLATEQGWGLKLHPVTRKPSPDLGIAAVQLGAETITVDLAGDIGLVNGTITLSMGEQIVAQENLPRDGSSDPVLLPLPQVPEPTRGLLEISPDGCVGNNRWHVWLMPQLPAVHLTVAAEPAAARPLSIALESLGLQTLTIAADAAPIAPPSATHWHLVDLDPLSLADWLDRLNSSPEGVKCTLWLGQNSTGSLWEQLSAARGDWPAERLQSFQPAEPIPLVESVGPRQPPFAGRLPIDRWWAPAEMSPNFETLLEIDTRPFAWHSGGEGHALQVVGVAPLWASAAGTPPNSPPAGVQLISWPTFVPLVDWLVEDPAGQAVPSLVPSSVHKRAGWYEQPQRVVVNLPTAEFRSTLSSSALDAFDRWDRAPQDGVTSAPPSASPARVDAGPNDEDQPPAERGWFRFLVAGAVLLLVAEMLLWPRRNTRRIEPNPANPGRRTAGATWP